MYYYKNQQSDNVVACEGELDLEKFPNFVEITKKQYDSKISIVQIKENLANTDYQAIKYAEGQISEEDYAPIKAQRQAWRDEINELEKIL